METLNLSADRIIKEEFGRITFEMLPFETAGGIQSREVASLNEQQSTLVLTYARNASNP